MFARTSWKKATPISLLFILVAFIFAGCGDDAKPPVAPPDNLISRANGGTATLNGQVTVTFPPETISEDAEVQIEIADTYPALPDGFGFASPVYDIALSVGQVVDTIFISVAYLNGMLPEGQLEASLLIGHVVGQNWVFEYPTIKPKDNETSTPSDILGQWAVIWPAQDLKGTVAGLLEGMTNDVGDRHRADFELALGATEVSAIVNSLDAFYADLDAASAGDPGISAALLKFIEANQDVENDGNEFTDYSAIKMARSFIELGFAIGHFSAPPGTGLPEVELGSRRYMPAAFAGFFVNYPGYSSVWSFSDVKQVKSTAEFQHDFFIQLNYSPTFGGLTFLDPPADIPRVTRTLSHGPTGTYRVNLVEGISAADKTVYYDYVRSRGIALYWPVESEVVLFNMLGVDNAVDAVGYTVETGDVIAEFQIIRDNPFSSAAQTDSTGAWLYIGFPVSLLDEPRKQDLRMNFITSSGGSSTETELMFPVNQRPWVYYGDWTPPSEVMDLAAGEYRGNSVRVSWTAPGNDQDSGTATWYDLRMAKFPIDESNWDQATAIIGEPAPAEAGTAQSLFLIPFDLSETVYMAMRTFDQDRNFSGLSNLLQMHNLGEIEVQFYDANLELAIRDRIGKPTDPITGADVAGITEVAAQSLNIRYLNGMEFLPQLTSLDMNGNLFLQDLNPLVYHYALRVLRLSLNRVTDLSPLAGMSDLQVLELGSNQVSDISQLASLKHLDSLDLSWNPVANFSPLAGLTEVSYLNLMEVKITDLTPLRTMTGLDHVLLNRNRITDLTPLLENQGFSTGDTIDVRDNPLSWQARNVQAPVLRDRGVTVLFTEP